MRARIEGVVLEKIHDKREEEGKQREKFLLRLFQRGEKQIVDVRVLPDQFRDFAEGEMVGLDCIISLWEFRGRTGFTVRMEGA